MVEPTMLSTRTRAWLRAPSASVYALAGMAAMFHLLLAGRYGFHRDELYYVEGGRHLAFGYVDHPPLTPMLARMVVAVAGERLWALRVVAAVAGALVVLGCALIARTLGGGRAAQTVAAGAAAVCPYFVSVSSIFSTTTFDLLSWTILLYLFSRLLGTDDDRLWIPLGIAFGIALEVKWLPLLLAAGFAVAVALDERLRAHTRRPGPWIGAALALALWAPNLVWQVANGWPTLEFTQNNNANVSEESGRLGFVLEQVALLVFLLPIAVAGVVWLWRRPRWRPLVVTAASVFVLLFALGGKAYYFAGMYPVLFAAGAVAVEGRRLGPAVAAVVATTLAFPFTTPLLPPRVVESAGIAEINDVLAEQFGWPELADQVAAAARSLPPHEQRNVTVLTASYGEAANLQHYLPDRGVPRDAVVSAHNSYADWWPAGAPDGTVVSVRYRPPHLRRFFASCEQVAVAENAYEMPNEVRGTPIAVCRDPKLSWDELRDALQRYE